MVTGVDGKVQKCSWKDFPLYKILINNDSHLYNLYSGDVDSVGLRNRGKSWEQFLHLRNQIIETGFINNVDNPVVVTHRLGQLDGAHRLAVLLATRGPNSKCVLIDGQVFVPHDHGNVKIKFIDVQNLEFVVRLAHSLSAESGVSYSQTLYRSVIYWAPSLAEKFYFKEK
jgi:hypothetical protein